MYYQGVQMAKYTKQLSELEIRKAVSAEKAYILFDGQGMLLRNVL